MPCGIRGCRQFGLPVFPTALLPKLRRSRRCVCVCEAALSETVSVWTEMEVLSIRCYLAYNFTSSTAMATLLSIPSTVICS